MTRSASSTALDLEGVGGDGLQVPLVDPVGLPELVDVAVEQQHLGLHAEGDGGGVHAGDAGADHHHLGRVDARHAAHQGAPATAGAHQVVGADLGRQPAGDLAHRRQQRQRAAVQLHRLVRDAGHLGVQQGVGAVTARRQVQVGEQGLARSHPVVLHRDRLLDLEHQLRVFPYAHVVVDDGRAGRPELLVGDRRTDAGAGLDQDLVPVPDELMHTGRCDGDPILLVLDLARYAYPHPALQSSPSAPWILRRQAMSGRA
jgi:hypothetical protein